MSNFHHTHHQLCGNLAAVGVRPGDSVMPLLCKFLISCSSDVSFLLVVMLSCVPPIAMNVAAGDIRQEQTNPWTSSI